MTTRDFERGYVCAVATMLGQHGESTMAEDALRAYGPIDWRNVAAYDRQRFKDAGIKLSDFERRESK